MTTRVRPGLVGSLRFLSGGRPSVMKRRLGGGAVVVGVAAMAPLLACSSIARTGVSQPSPHAASARVASGAAAVNTVDLAIAPSSTAETLLVDLHSLDTTIRVDARYATTANFTGAPLPGYLANRALLRREAAVALAAVSRAAGERGLALKVFDGYRPVRATDAMVAWTRRVGRDDLLRDGYIASRSRHNLGLAVDLTLVERRSAVELPMGTEFDSFSSAAHTTAVVGATLVNRLLLKVLMEAAGFVAYDQEWWHFSFAVPDPVRFDLVIR
ncbi:MAG: hypothetical protein NVS4B3_01710 [Gemmatimonadaceae bacterium]